ncbi:hypothetical protein GSUB_16670 (plasmid) [Geoalkalibacter subterraneus]|uniref:Uncharacterized protein n=1 Tax=Geoalkalibacter subterraneus TaxID=483547 RepID=A0A0B5FVD1_9BACT|nr:hypothetical protein GSUB_16670 [Geoalkalibacter subterraneus]
MLTGRQKDHSMPAAGVRTQEAGDNYPAAGEAAGSFPAAEMAALGRNLEEAQAWEEARWRALRHEEAARACLEH